MVTTVWALELVAFIWVAATVRLEVPEIEIDQVSVQGWENTDQNNLEKQCLQ